MSSNYQDLHQELGHDINDLPQNINNMSHIKPVYNQLGPCKALKQRGNPPSMGTITRHIRIMHSKSKSTWYFKYFLHRYRMCN